MPRLKPAIQIFFLLLIALFSFNPISIMAQSDESIKCDDIPPSVNMAPIDFSDCSVVLLSEEVDETLVHRIEFSAIASGCSPVLKNEAVDLTNRVVRLNLEVDLPPDLTCPTVISVYSVETEPLPLSNGKWRVDVVVSDEFEGKTFVGEVDLSPQIVRTETTVYLPIIRK